MAEYDRHFFEEEVYRSWRSLDQVEGSDYKDLSDDEKFKKLYRYVLEHRRTYGKTK
jgi:hypothetical protein